MEQHQRLVKTCTLASISLASILIALKLYAWFITDSVSVLASLLDSVMDLLASAITFVAVRFALLPPDDNHRFGHGKAEPLAALAQAAFIMGSAMMLILHSIDIYTTPRTRVQLPTIGAAITLLSILMTLILVKFQHYVIQKVGSEAIAADALHYKGDILINLAVLVALIAAEWRWFWLDPCMGFGIAAVLIWGAIGIAKNSLSSLMDEEVGPELEHCILESANSVSQCIAVREIRTRRAGPQIFAQLHMVFEASTPLAEAHHSGNQLIEKVRQFFPGVSITIHHDPYINSGEHAPKGLGFDTNTKGP